MNPFVYPKGLHRRNYVPRPYKRYQTYKRLLRLEFVGKCVYCQMPSSMRGYASFSVDHYRPKKRFPHLETAYTNLYFCCHACNSRKGSYWPKSAALERTHFIPNPCDHLMFTHLQFKGAQVEGKTPAGRVATEILDLNDPESLEFREFIQATAVLWEQKKADALAKMSKVAKRLKAGSMTAAMATQATTELTAVVATADNALSKLSGIPK